MKKIALGVVTLAVAFSFSLSGAANYNFQADLTLGSTGADVTALQSMLVAKGYLVMPAGTAYGYFGGLTQSAVAKLQMANGITPAAGYFGPVTRAKVNTMSADGGATGGTGTPSTPGSLSGGDGDFNDFDLLGDPSGEDVEEGEEVAVLGFEFEADDSDLLVERLDIEVSADSDEKPWKYLESLTLFNGDDEVASIDASDSDEWDETNTDDEYEATFSEIDSVVEEGDMAEFYIKAEAKSSIDDSDLPIVFTVNIPTDGLRALNAEGINVYEGSNDSETFTLEAAEAGEFDISVDEDDNEDDVVEVDEDVDTDEVVLYVATIESDQGDNLIEEVSFFAESGTADISNLVKTFYLEVDGDEVASESSTGLEGTGTTTFEDLDIEIAEDEEVEVRILATVRSTDEGDNYTSGDTLQVTNMAVDYVDSNDDDLTEVETTDGGVITLSDDSVMVELASEPTATQGDNETRGTYVVKFDVTAPSDDDIYIDLDSAAQSFAIINASTGATTTATTTSATLAGGTITGGKIKISEGQSKTLTLTVNLDNTGGVERSLRVGLTTVYYRVGSAGASEELYTSGLDEDYETEDLLLLTANLD